jgi:SAM-dependent methyltransferase
MTLLEIYNATGAKSDKEHFHKYITGFYGQKFDPLQKENLNILEIGLFRGDSIKLWEDFFVNSHVYCADITTDHLHHEFSDRVEIFKRDAYTEDFLQFLRDRNLKFDIIIDDGPHSIESQDFSCKNFFDFLKPNGILIVEDVVDYNVQKLQQQNPNFHVVNLLHLAIAWNDSIIFYRENI